jgi:cytoplasmic iron level regulating protein YaaA (DUF328/UPF0246 family)
MITVISPAKTLDFGAQCLTSKSSQPEFLDHSAELIAKLRTLKEGQLSELMGISEKLASLNAERYRDWSQPFSEDNAKQALLAFKGDVYTGFDLESWAAKDFDYAQKHLRILSGLYGVLRPLDLMQAYRLEMGTGLATKRGKNLYAFWGTIITEAINDALAESKSKVLVNLASNEYFSSIVPGKLKADIVVPVFKDEKNGKYKIISFFAKKARGMMSDFILRNRIRKPVDLRGFDTAGYTFDEAGSSAREMVFLRGDGVR